MSAPDPYKRNRRTCPGGRRCKHCGNPSRRQLNRTVRRTERAKLRQTIDTDTRRD